MKLQFLETYIKKKKINYVLQLLVIKGSKERNILTDVIITKGVIIVIKIYIPVFIHFMSFLINSTQYNFIYFLNENKTFFFHRKKFVQIIINEEIKSGFELKMDIDRTVLLLYTCTYVQIIQ